MCSSGVVSNRVKPGFSILLREAMPRSSTFVSHLGQCHSECSDIPILTWLKSILSKTSPRERQWSSPEPEFRVSNKRVVVIVVVVRYAHLTGIIDTCKNCICKEMCRVFAAVSGTYPSLSLSAEWVQPPRDPTCHFLAILSYNLQCRKEEGKYEGQLEKAEKISSSLVDGMTCVFFSGESIKQMA